MTSNSLQPIIYGSSFNPLALLVPGTFSLREKTLKFFTEKSTNFQVGMMLREKGHVIQEHVHLNTLRNIEGTCEAIWIRKGKCRVIFYDTDTENEEKHEILLEQGDLIVFFRGGHKFEMVEDCEILEIKQGPFDGNLDKVRIY